MFLHKRSQSQSEYMHYKKVFVGLSGGVDSSVTAALLQERGYDVTGVYIKGWYPEWKECNWKENRRDAMRVAATLDIPFMTLDMSEEYKKDVVDYFLSEYGKGRTPNPDVMCNKHIKFGSFYQWALGQGADFVATGHYARITEGKNGHMLCRGKDQAKDQSYFLWSIAQEQLPHIMFPLGDMEKKNVRTLAEKYALPTSDKKDSQGICFLEDVTMEEFLKHYFPTHKGSVLLDGTEEIIGEHDGAVLYTIGQRHGFATYKKSTHEDPYFVVSKNLENNTITVSHSKPTTHTSDVFILENENWLHTPIQEKRYLVQTRYRQRPSECVIRHDSADQIRIRFLDTSERPAPGQSAVLYDGDVVIGGGIIS